MDLFEDAGMQLAKQRVPKRPGTLDDDPEFTSRALLELMELPIGPLADVFYSYLDIDPRGVLAKTKQIKKIIRKRGLGYAELGDAWEKVRDEMKGDAD
jgi:hypothetical protein